MLRRFRRCSATYEAARSYPSRAGELQERGIALAWVERIARTPLWIEPERNDPALERRFGTIPEFGGRTLRVVCGETDDAIRIVTAMFDRNARRKP